VDVLKECTAIKDERGKARAHARVRERETEREREREEKGGNENTQKNYQHSSICLHKRTWFWEAI